MAVGRMQDGDVLNPHPRLTREQAPVIYTVDPAPADIETLQTLVGGAIAYEAAAHSPE